MWDDGKEKQVIGQILQALRGLRYGTVQITVQDSKVVQIDRTDKLRFTGQVPSREKGGDGMG